MAAYTFVTEWFVDAPVERVWEALQAAERWPEWWRSVAGVEELEAGDEQGVGRRLRFMWTTRLPYRLRVDMRVTRVEAPLLLEGAASGELQGTGLWQLAGAGGRTTVRYTWKVRTTRAWMNLFAPIARPLFAWNHDAVMRDGRDGLAHFLGVRVVDGT